MKITIEKLNNKWWKSSPKIIFSTLVIGLLNSPIALGDLFVFPESVSLERHTLAESFVDSHLLKSVDLRGQQQLAGYVKDSILSPRRDLKGSVISSMVLTKISDDGKHARYSQRFNGYEVFGGEMIAHLDKQGLKLQRVTGNFITGLEASSIAKKVALSPNQAVEKAKKQIDKSHSWEFHNTQSELVVYHNPNLQGFKPALAYIVNFLATSKTADPTRPFLVIDAVTGEILDKWEGLNT